VEVGGCVPLVPLLPLPEALPVLLVSVAAVVVVELVTGVPPPVSVAVVPVDDGWMVSVDPTLLSVGLRLQAAASRRAAKRIFLIANRGPTT
jgi:hypothetical protein